MSPRDPWPALAKHVLWIGVVLSLCLKGATSEVVLRLADGTDEANGRVEVFYEGTWGTVCDDYFDHEDATLICRLLGYMVTLGYFHYNVYGVGSGQIWEALDCQTSASNFTDCFTLSPISGSCDHRDDVGLACSSVSLTDVSFRLVNGPSALSGRVEVFYDGAWGTICHDYFDRHTADVICRTLGYEHVLAYHANAQYGEGTGYIWAGVQCPSGATNFSQCVAQWHGYSCLHTQDVGIECGKGTLNDVSIRLVNGTDESNGLIEVYYDGAWGTICSYPYFSYTGDFICRALGYEYSLGISTDVDVGQETGYIWRGLICRFSTTQHFSDCVAQQATNIRCDHNALSVRCSNGTLADVSFRLVGGTSTAVGRVEVFYDGAWGTICDQGFDYSTAEFICRTLGYGDALVYLENAAYGEGSGYIWTGVRCPDGANEFTECVDGRAYSASCGHRNDISVECTNGSLTDVSFRLVNGPSALAGRVEVFYDGAWGTICSYNFVHDTGDFICRALGYENVLAYYYYAQYGEGTGYIWAGVGCPSGATNFSQCVAQYNAFSCDHTMDVGVECGTGTLNNVSFRLVNGTNESNGLIEVHYDGLWGVICGYPHYSYTSNVICRALGYEFSLGIFTDVDFGPGTGYIWRGLRCPYSTTHYFSDCVAQQSTAIRCVHNALAVRCSNGTLADVSFRLVDGTSTAGGRVEVLYDGAWGTICDRSFDYSTADFICRTLGYGDVLAWFPNAAYGEGSGYIWTGVRCPVGANKFSECVDGRAYSSHCQHTDDISVECGNGTLTGVSFRLVNGPSALAGRVEVFYDGAWGTICGSHFSPHTADFICRALGYEHALAHYGSAEYGAGTGYIWTSVGCPSGATNFSQCVAQLSVYLCSHTDDAGVECGTGTLNDVSFRLVNGTDESNGLIEVYYDGAWGTICSYPYHSYTGDFICRALGFKYSLAISTDIDDGHRTGYMWRGMRCPSSTTQYFSECVAQWRTTILCNHHALAVLCLNGTLEDVLFRLVGGSSAAEGRVEVFYDGAWGTISDSSFDYFTADLICRTLGYGNTLAYLYGGAYGEGSGYIWTGLRCPDEATDFSECVAQRGSYVYHYDNDLSVECGNGSLADVSFRLVNGTNDLDGRVEVFYDESWGTICDNYMSRDTADFICRALGYESVLAYYKNAEYGEGTGYIWKRIRCPSGTRSFSECSIYGSYTCDHSNDVAVACINGPLTDVSFRLMDGRSPADGRVEVFYDDSWGTICGDGFSIDDAEFICRALGYQSALSFTDTALYGEGTGFVWRVNCPNGATNFAECVTLGEEQLLCSHANDIGISCEHVVISLYPRGSSNARIHSGTPHRVDLSHVVLMFAQPFDKLYIYESGYVTLRRRYETFSFLSIPTDVDILAPFYAWQDASCHGTAVYYQVFTDDGIGGQEVLDRANRDISNFTGRHDISMVQVLVITWWRLLPYPCTYAGAIEQGITYQLVLASDLYTTYLLYIYPAEIPQDAHNLGSVRIGYNFISGQRQEPRISGTAPVLTMLNAFPGENTNIPGTWLYYLHDHTTLETDAGRCTAWFGDAPDFPLKLLEPSSGWDICPCGLLQVQRDWRFCVDDSWTLDPQVTICYRSCSIWYWQLENTEPSHWSTQQTSYLQNLAGFGK